MICKFCKESTVDKSLNVTPQRNMKVDFCETCHAEYVYWVDTDKTPYAVHLYTTINDKLYRWSFYEDEQEGRLWYYEEPGIPGLKPNRKAKLLKVFHDYFPDITPVNITDKVKMILLFL